MYKKTDEALVTSKYAEYYPDEDEETSFIQIDTTKPRKECVLKEYMIATEEEA